MVINRPFDEVLRSWSHVAVLRALIDTSVGRTGNEVARVSGMQPRSALKALTSLEELGVVRRQIGGRDHLFTLNREHYLVAEGLLALYKSESDFQPSIEQALSAPLQRKVVSAVLFGSVVRKEETPQSDLDFCCIVRSEKQKQNIAEILASLSASLYRKFGLRLAPVLFSTEEFKRKLRSQLIREILKEGKTILGKTPKELARG